MLVLLALGAALTCSATVTASPVKHAHKHARDGGAIELPGTVAPEPAPPPNETRPPNTAPPAISVAPAEHQTLTASTGGRAVGWGEDWFGNLGTIYRTLAEEVHVPTADGLGGIQSLATSENSGYALLENGEAVAFGANGHGQLGDDSEDHSYFDEKSEVPVEQQLSNGQIAPLTGIASLSAAEQHVIALLEDGTVKTWGNDEYGQLGRGTGGFVHETHELTDLPLTVGALSAPALAELGLPPVVAVKASGGDDFAILANGEVLGWGKDDSGQTGVGPPHYEADGTTIPRSELCHGEMGVDRCITSPRLVVLANGEPLRNVTAIAGGLTTTYALLGNGHVMAWGSNSNGQLGAGRSAATGGQTRGQPPAEVRNSAQQPLTEVRSIAAAAVHAIALRQNGELVGWGNVDEGVLGAAHNEECGPGKNLEQHEQEHERKGEPNAHPCVKFATQVLAAGALGATHTAIKEIAAGGRFNIILDSAGHVYTWGSDKYGQLGDGHTSARGSAAPKRVAEPGAVTQVVAGGKFALTLLAPGTPAPPPLVSLQPDLGAFDVAWGFAADRLNYRVGRKTEPADPSAATEFSIEEAGPPQDVVAPAIEFHDPEEIAEENLELTAERGKWNGERPLSSTIRWQRCPAGVSEPQQLAEECEDLPRQVHQRSGVARSETTYVPVAADVGHALRFIVTIRNEYVPAAGGGKLHGSAILASQPSGEVQRASASQHIEQVDATTFQQYTASALRGEPLRPVPYEINLDAADGARPRMMRTTPLGGAG